MPSWKRVIVSGSDAVLNSLNTTTALTASGLIYPTTDGTVNQAIVTDGAGNLSFDNPYSSNTVVYGKNLSGTTILKGTPLYFTGSGAAGNIVGVLPADAGNPARMPAGGIAGEQLLDEAEGIILLDGFISGVNTSAFNSGDLVYVAVGGGYTNVAPTGSSNLIQALGYVEKVDVSNGSGVIKGPGIFNSVPNIQQGYTWVGNVNGVATPTPTSSFSVASAVSASFATTASYAANADLLDGRDSTVFATTGSNQFNGNQTITGSLTIITGSTIELQVTNTGVNIGNATADTHNVTGSLRVSGSMDLTGNARVSGSSVFSGSVVITGTPNTSTSSSLVVYGSGSSQPVFTVQGSQGELFSITDSLSGSLFSVNDISGLPILEVFSNGDTLIGDYTAPAVYTTRRVASTTAGVNVIYSLATSSYDGVFVDYTIRSGSVGRAGNFMAMWSGSSTDFTDNSINGFGTTSNFVFGASISGSNLIVSGSGSTSGWTVKTIIRGI